MINLLFLKINKHLLRLPRFVKQLIMMLIDIFSIFISIVISIFLLSENLKSYTELFFLIFPISLVSFIPVFFIFGVYKNLFRFSGNYFFISISKAFSIHSIIFLLITIIIDSPYLPNTLGILYLIILLNVLFFNRIFISTILLSNLKIKTNSLKSRVLIYGAGEAGRKLADSLIDDPEMKIFGFLDDDIKIQGKKLNNIIIYGTENLSKLIKDKSISHIFLALPSVSKKNKSVIIKRLSDFPVIIKTIPSLKEIAKDFKNINNIKELQTDEILGRDEIVPVQNLLKKINYKSNILVTGAGGSIGSELCRQLIHLKPNSICLAEMNEFSLYKIYGELNEIKLNNSSLSKVNLIPVLTNLLSDQDIENIFVKSKPSVIYHAAAYKHVPLVEKNICYSLKNNIINTLLLAKKSIDFKVPHFVMISSDKAVNPANVMGASKRISELILQSLQKSPSNLNTCFSMVRFGNVLNSSGSVIPLFQRQIKAGGPITITHKDVSRYFMSIPEAAQLVLQSGALASGGEIYILDMGEQIKILDLARLLVNLSGLTIKDEQNPDGDIKVIYTGLRKGEKMKEELFISDKLFKTEHPKILYVNEPNLSLDLLEYKLDKLIDSINKNDEPLSIKIINEIIPEFKINIFDKS